MKNFGVAAALILCAVAASASNFRVADQVYVPVAAHAGGSSGTFITDAYLANLSADSVDVSVLYIPLGENSGGQTPAGLEELRGFITLLGFERKEYRDIFATTLGKPTAFGMLVFNGCKAATSCAEDTQDDDGVSPNFRPISVQTRIYQVTPQRPLETTGQLFTGIPWYNFVSTLQSNVGLDQVFIVGLTQTGGAGQAQTFRSNIGVVNASEYSKTDIRFRLYQGTLSEADRKGEAVRTLGPLGSQLYGFTALFPGVTGTNFFVTVEQLNVVGLPSAPSSCEQGCPAFLAYGSVLDNLSGDATTMEAQYLKEISKEVLDVLYPTGVGKPNNRRKVRH